MVVAVFPVLVNVPGIAGIGAVLADAPILVVKAAPFGIALP